MILLGKNISYKIQNFYYSKEVVLTKLCPWISNVTHGQKWLQFALDDI